MDQDNKLRCQIIRKGIVERFENEYVVLNIEGKTVSVPRSKVDPTLDLGDVVRWNGDKWVKYYDIIE